MSDHDTADYGLHAEDDDTYQHAFNGATTPNRLTKEQKGCDA
jgi:hypothetical protein